MPVPDLSFEHEAYRQGYRLIAGIDEVGRGSLAGPVVAAAVILPPGLIIDGVNDSKKLTPARREVLYHVIHQHALATGIGVVGNEDIDRVNILRATIRAMEMAVRDLKISPDYLLIDAVSLSDSRIPQRPIIKGDMLSISIAAASIVAKVTRDRLMTEEHSVFPQYNFMTHKGYATRDHVSRLRLYGPSIIHRKSFLKKLLGPYPQV
ncbi:MAG: ribonuclease HII [Nitrospirae bacterium]|nr:ribonuclease HII [Nitrospirota bacterium]MBI5096122.1 ribonuclease HII [Nitrospirota bacterium]